MATFRQTCVVNKDHACFEACMNLSSLFSFFFKQLPAKRQTTRYTDEFAVLSFSLQFKLELRQGGGEEKKPTDANLFIRRSRRSASKRGELRRAAGFRRWRGSWKPPGGQNHWRRRRNESAITRLFLPHRASERREEASDIYRVAASFLLNPAGLRGKPLTVTLKQNSIFFFASIETDAGERTTIH